MNCRHHLQVMRVQSRQIKLQILSSAKMSRLTLAWRSIPRRPSIFRLEDLLERLA